MGEYQHSLDVKGRLFMPAKLRDGLGEKFIITRGLDNCIWAFSMTEWQILEEKSRSLSFNSRDTRVFMRFIFGGAAVCEPDKQGRFLIPANLREYANLEKDAIVMGLPDKVEIWSKELWEKYAAQEEPRLVEIVESINLDSKA